MSKVTLTVGGRNYAVACGTGEEDHILRLGKVIDEKVSSVSGGKPAPEGQALLFAALILADELQDAAKAEPSQSSPLEDADLAGALERFAEVIENCAEKLESRVSAP